ncbi:hypothetical protein [Croceivirga thetidis]|uniref:Uncharacterized protein n=1 Tax=Croceivirga thetidis TaxID=2721623 RepID=A0ABX1GVH7_9FLAO|nr:hypothetical protein [Croceivirga thetidis]NKI32995.1 hypothetical protein [Croceivirga thetidis]
MTFFFGILITLLVINVVLLVFTTSSSQTSLNKTIQKASEGSITKLFPRQASENEYKKAV